MTTKYMYESKAGYEWLDAVTALGKAIMDSLGAGRRTVPMTVADFCTVMWHADRADGRSLDEQLLAFASNCGLRFALENHAQDVRFWV